MHSAFEPSLFLSTTSIGLNALGSGLLSASISIRAASSRVSRSRRPTALKSSVTTLPAIKTLAATKQTITSYIDTKQDSDENLEIISSLEHGDGNFIVSDGTDWTVESDSTARASLGLGTIATQDIENIDIDGGSIDGTTIGSTSPTTGSFTTLDASSRAYVGSVTINSGSITDDSGSISFGDANISTTGNVTVSDTVSAEQLTSTDDLIVADQASIDGTLTLATGSITDSGGAIDFGNGDLSTTGTLASGTQTVTGNVTASGTIQSEDLTVTNDLTVNKEASIDGTLTLTTGSITDSDGSISFGNEDLSTLGTFSSGIATLTSR